MSDRYKKFQIMIENGDLMKCEGNCKHMKLQMGGYHVKKYTLAIVIGGCDIVLGEEWIGIGDHGFQRTVYHLS